MALNSNPRVPSDKIEELLDRLLGGREAGTRAPLYGGIQARGSDCPDDALWERMAAERLNAKESERLTEHAASCYRCGAILKFWAGILSDEQSPAETAALAKISALHPVWQEHMAKKLLAAAQGSTAGVSGSRIMWPAVMAIGGLVAAAALAFVFFGSFRAQSSPERLLAEAYSSHRIMATRIPLAGFAPVDTARHSRAAGTSRLSDSVPLLEARAAINQALMKTPEDPHWLLLQARSDLLNESYESAIDTLKRLHANDPDNVAVLTDLASAYVMRSKETDAATDEATALDYLAQAARLQPDNPVALYNDAVVLQDLFQYSSAIEVWKRFLAIEHDKAWLADGKRHLDEIEAIEAKVKAQQSLLEPLLSGPNGMLHLARSPAVIADYDEELSTGYLPKLLKTAYPLPSNPSLKNSTSHPAECSDSCNAARVLLHAIAASLEEHHGDRWLADMMAGSSAPEFAAGANFLASAIADGPHASPAVALAEARSAQREFERSGNVAGMARARTEEVYNFEHLRELPGCLATSRELSSQLMDRHYPWIDAQFHADQAACERMQNGFDSSEISLMHSVNLSSTAGYRIMHLRASGFLASEERFMGNRSRAWTMNLQNLRSYWQGNYPQVRALNLYNNLADEEEASSRSYSATILRREAVHQAELLPNPDMVVANRLFLVSVEIEAEQMREASNDISLAKAELAQLPGREFMRANLAEARISLAEAYLASNDMKAAKQALQDKTANGYGVGDRDLELRYTAVEGHLSLLEGRNQDAEEALTHAVAMTELGYREITSLQERMDWIEKARDVYAALALTWLREGKDPLDVLALWERYRLLSSGVTLQQWCHEDESELNCLTKPLSGLRSAMTQETVVGTIRLDGSILLWTMDDRGIQMREIQTDAVRFDLLCHTFFEALATPSSSEASIRSYGKHLADTLLTPIADRLDARRTLIFDLGDSMEFLPVGALQFNGNYLGLQIPVTTVHSVLLARREISKAGNFRKSIVIGSSNPADPDVPRLPEAKMEADEVASVLASPRVFTGNDALASSIRAATPHAGLLHFAGHTNFVDGSTRLLLARPLKGGADWLDARAFRSQAFADCRLVVLSACSTGKREERSSDDIQDMVQTLTAEGAQQVVATHWDVDSAISVQLMKNFYAGLARGLTVPQALLEAESAVSANAEFHHPYFWAPYYVIGMGTTNLKELFHSERGGNDSDRHHSTTGFPSRNPI